MMRAAGTLCISLGAIALALLVAQNCDAPDWQQGLMLLAAPPIAGAGAGLTVAWASRGNHVLIGLGVALLVAAVAFLAIVIVWGGGCSS